METTDFFNSYLLQQTDVPWHGEMKTTQEDGSISCRAGTGMNEPSPANGVTELNWQKPVSTFPSPII
ncbi:hypothetical protein R1flu_027511 [Riccia fluitans]|uniref:Uncharacterized protein n=1 Tax=Riccia fluitans TaxID=41844 RepID=A0ABD1XN22_9MARC